MKGDYTPGKVIYIRFNTHKADGTPITLGGTPVVSVYKQNSTSESTSGVTLTADYDSRTGLHQVEIDTSSDGTFYSAGSDFDVIITTGTVDSISVVGTVVGSFSLSNRSSLRPTVADRTLDVSSGGEAGIDWANVGSPTTSVNLSSTTISTSQGVDVLTAVGTAWGSGAITAASIAAAALNGKGDWNVGKTGYTLTPTTGLGAQTADITGSLSGSVGSVTGNVGGSVASVIGNVGGNVVGTVTSVLGSIGGNVSGNVLGSVAYVAGNVSGSVASVVGGINTGSGTITTLDALDTAQDAQHATTQGKVDTVDTVVDAIKAKTDNLPAAFPTNFSLLSISDGGGVYADGAIVDGYTSEGETNTIDYCRGAIEYYNLDHLVKSAVDTDFATTVHLNSVIGQLADNGTSATFDRTTDSLEAISVTIGTAGAGLTALAPAATALSTATWTGTRAGYLDNINNANLANVPAFPTNFAELGINSSGHISRVTLADTATTVTALADYTSTRAGYLDNINNANLVNVPAFPTNFAELAINSSGHISRVTLADTLTANADKTGYSITGTLTTLDAFNTSLNSAHGSGSWETATGFSTLDAAGVRTAVGLESANLDTQLSTIDTAVDAIKAKTDNLPSSPAAVGSAMTLASGSITTAVIADGAITDAKFTLPAEAAGRPTTLLAWIRRAGEWVINRRTRNQTTGEVTLYGADNTTVLETQTQSQSESGGDTIDNITKGA